MNIYCCASEFGLKENSDGVRGGLTERVFQGNRDYLRWRMRRLKQYGTHWHGIILCHFWLSRQKMTKKDCDGNAYEGIK
jgi:hypothetical protein